MKKHILLTTTAMLLSAVALNANADSNSAQLEVEAMFVKPFQLASEQYLGFGMILADGGNKTVVVKPDGSLGEDTDATMISKASFQNYGNGTTSNGSLNEGIIRAKGILDDDYDGSYFPTPNEETLNALLSISFSDTSLELKSNTDSVTCGTVTDFTTNITVENNDALIHVGGKLTTANLTGASRTLVCNAYTTVTVVFNDTVMSDIRGQMRE